MVWSVARRGAGALNLDLITKTPVQFNFGNAPSGLSNAFAGTLVIVALATAMALPVGILVAIYLNEFARPWIRSSVSLALDVLNGVPAIVIGIFVFGLFVVGHGQSGYAGAFALACLMLAARRTLDAWRCSRSCRTSLREASLALGVPRWRTTLSIVLPQTVGGIVTGTVLAVARVAGETAPLLFTTSIVGTQLALEPPPRAADRAGRDLRALRVGRPAGSRPGVGGGARPARSSSSARACRALARHAQPADSTRRRSTESSTIDRAVAVRDQNASRCRRASGSSASSRSKASTRSTAASLRSRT